MTPREREPRTPSKRTKGPGGSGMPSDPSMRDLLASCAAASAVSTPPADGPTDTEADGDTDTAGDADESPGHSEARQAARTPYRRTARTVSPH